jgi:hypothetical protein
MFISLNSSEFALIIVGAGAAGPPFGPIGTCRERHERLPEPSGVLDAFRSSSPSRSDLLADTAPNLYRPGTPPLHEIAEQRADEEHHRKARAPATAVVAEVTFDLDGPARRLITIPTPCRSLRASGNLPPAAPAPKGNRRR